MLLSARLPSPRLAFSTRAGPEILCTSTPADSRQTPPSPPPSQRPFLARLWPPEWLNPDAARVDLRQQDPTRSGPACHPWEKQRILYIPPWPPISDSGAPITPMS